MIIGNNWQNDEYIGQHRFSNGHVVNIYHVNSVHTLNLLVGYAKYKNKDEGHIYLRGQTKLYDNMRPSLARNSESLAVSQKLSSYIGGCTKNITIIKTTPQFAKEPLLQHYGIKTKWLDLVDNLWVALFFGLYDIDEKIFGKVYNNVKLRNIHRPSTSDLADPNVAKNYYQYLLLFLCDSEKSSPKKPGYYIGSTTNSIDLRKAVPSVFLRPHAQHAVLMRNKLITDGESTDLSRQIVLAIRMYTFDVYDWLGNGRLVSPENIFPAPFYDNGYSILLENAPFNKNNVSTIGSITQFSFSSPK